MEAGIIILVLLLGVLLAVIIAALAGKRKDSDRISGYGPGPGSLTSTIRKKEVMVDYRTTAEPVANQITICAHRTSGPVRLCPVCDGENPPAAAHCHICGRQLN